MAVKQLLQPIIDTIVARHPWAFRTALSKVQPHAFVDSIGTWDKQSYNNFKFSGQLNGFEDIVTLFSIGRFNRGVIRLELDEAALLFKTVQSMDAPVGVEIGRGWGGSTMLLAIAVGEKGKIKSVELTPTHDEELAKILESGGISNRVELIVGDSRKADVGRTLDFAFIDGCHDYELAKHDHLRFGALVKSGGYIMHHDLTNERPDASCSKSLLQLRDEILQHQQGSIQVHRQAGSLMVFRKISDAWPTF